MIKQAPKSTINSRSECNPFDKTGFLPIMTSNMYSVVGKHNAHIFLDNKIKVCMPRGEYMDCSYQHCSDENYFDSYSLDNFIKNFVDTTNGFLRNQKDEIVKTSVCIDTAAGHLKKLHDAIRKAKEIYGNNLIIMAGNVASVDAFLELAKTGVDYIRVGIGGGGGCNTTSNTGVGQEDLEELIKHCLIRKNNYKQSCTDTYLPYKEFNRKHEFVSNELKQMWANISSVKIVADGISTYIKQCETKYRFNDNGYAAINKLLYAGADLVMVGKLFAQTVESAGEKAVYKHTNNDYTTITNETLQKRYEMYKDFSNCYVKYSGMSTQQEQKKYKKPNIKVGDIFYLKTDIYKKEPIKCTMIEEGFTWGIVQNCSNCKETGYSWDSIKNDLKPSEGLINWIPVRWTLNEWLNGSEYQDEDPYLMGYVHSLCSAMSYTNALTLNDFKQ